ncbi:MAG: hypothetical protein Pg6B_10720 [Candidatus Azobacteroides pseudotrichonymphae]|nr:MAG: hypothetical protein Pg6B_10720 [Candidatus Azobacteroides pseudotrichonymphae]
MIDVGDGPIPIREYNMRNHHGALKTGPKPNTIQVDNSHNSLNHIRHLIIQLKKLNWSIVLCIICTITTIFCTIRTIHYAKAAK